MRDTETGGRIVVVGAGPVGLAVAALLAHGPAATRLRLRVVDSQPPPVWNLAAIDSRVYALSRGAQRIFAQLGQWDTMCARRVSPYERMRVWQGDRHEGPAAIDFDCADIGEPDLGHIVEDALIRDALLSALAGHVELSFGAAVAGVAQVADGMRITLDSGETLGADLLVAADGGASRVRSLLAMPVLERSYAQHAIVTHVTTAAPHAHTAWQRFLPTGPLAFLPLTDGRSSVVWSMPSDRARALLACNDAEFLLALQTAAGSVLGTLGPSAARAAFPLTKLHAVEYCRRGVALVGDAAHCVHPLAGQGMNLGLLDAACLAEELARAALGGEHVGDARVLQRYARLRKLENLGMLLACDALERLFRLPLWSVPLRGLGLAAVDRAMPIKRALMRRALGLRAGRAGEQYAPIRGLMP